MNALPKLLVFWFDVCVVKSQNRYIFAGDKVCRRCDWAFRSQKGLTNEASPPPRINQTDLEMYDSAPADLAASLDVASEVGALGEALGTVETLVGTRAGVCASMTREFVAGTERLDATLTAERTLAAVHALVNLKRHHKLLNILKELKSQGKCTVRLPEEE